MAWYNSTWSSIVTGLHNRTNTAGRPQRAMQTELRRRPPTASNLYRGHDCIFLVEQPPERVPTDRYSCFSACGVDMLPARPPTLQRSHPCLSLSRTRSVLEGRFELLRPSIRRTPSYSLDPMFSDQVFSDHNVFLHFSKFSDQLLPPKKSAPNTFFSPMSHKLGFVMDRQKKKRFSITFFFCPIRTGLRPFLTRKFFQEILGLVGSKNFLGKFRQVHNLNISGRLLRSNIRVFFKKIFLVIYAAYFVVREEGMGWGGKTLMEE